MEEASHPFFKELLVLLAGSVIAVALFRRLRLPPVLAYLTVGLVVGPHGLGLVPHGRGADVLAQFGVVFLLFTVGLKFSLAQFLAMRRTALGLGGSQVVVTTALFSLAAWLAGLAALPALVVGGSLAMSSTAMVTKLLDEQSELISPHGRGVIGVLLFQDIAVLPFLIAIPVVVGAGKASLGLALAAALGKGVLLIIGMLAVGRWLLRPVLQEVAAARSSELFTLAALLFALTAAAASWAAGLSMPLGAFLAGMILGETEFRHQIEADIRPFQDVLLGLFFITIGMLLDLRALPSVLIEIVVATVGLLLCKALLVTGLARLGGIDPDRAVRTGVVLAQGGEFGLAIVSLALTERLVPEPVGQIALSTIILSLFVTPFLVRHNGDFARWLLPAAWRRNWAQTVIDVASAAKGISGHVVICGYGRIGQSLARLLEGEDIPYMALDLDALRVREARAAGDPVSFGDATQFEILNAAGLARARALVVSFDDPSAAATLISVLRHHGYNLPVLIRTRDDSELERLQRVGATEVVPETLEATLILASHLLLLLGVSATEVARHMQSIRRDRYRMLRGFFLGQEPIPFEAAEAARERLHTVTLPSQAHAVGRHLAELDLQRLDVVVTAVRRRGIRGQQPQPEMSLRAGDTLVLYGAPENLARAEAALLRGG